MDILALGFQLWAFSFVLSALCFHFVISALGEFGALPLIVLLYNTISSGDVVGVLYCSGVDASNDDIVWCIVWYAGGHPYYKMRNACPPFCSFSHIANGAAKR